MKKIIFPLLLVLVINAFAQQISVAVLPSDGDEKFFNNDDLEALTNKMRSVALKTLPRESFTLLTQDVVVKRLGGAENFIKECRESSCIVDLGKKAQVDYIAQASVGKLRNKMRIKVEVYDVSTSGLVGMYDGDGEYFDDYFVLLKAIDENVPDIFRKIPNAVPSQAKISVEPKPVPVENAPAGGGSKENGKRAWSIGIRTGLNSSYTEADVYNEAYFSGDYGDILGMQIGAVFDFALTDWFHLQPGLMYVQKGMNDGGDITIHYLELPLLLSLKFSAFRVNAGPYLAYAVSSDIYFDEFDYGLSAGIGFDIGMFYIGMFYDYGIMNYYGEGNYYNGNNTRGNFYNRTLGLNVGINL